MRPMPLRELAKLAGVSPGTLGELEQGRHEPRLGTMLALRDALGLSSVEELLGPMPSETLTRVRQAGQHDDPTTKE